MRQSKNKDRTGIVRPKDVRMMAIKKENLKLQQRIAKLEAQLITAQNRINALEKERYTGLENLSDSELLKRIEELDRKLRRK